MAIRTSVQGVIKWRSGKRSPIGLSGIGTSFVAGAFTVVQVISLSGIGSGAAAGTLNVVEDVGLTGIASSEAVGTPRIQGVIGLTGIASSTALGTPFLEYSQFLSLNGIASSGAVGTPTVASDSTLSLPGIQSRVAFGPPIVAGPVILSGIGSSFVAGSFVVNVVQNVSFTGIPSSTALGVPRVGNTQSVSLSGIASVSVLGTPKIEGGPQHVALSGIGPGAAGIPAILGGASGVQVYIGKINRTRFFQLQSANIHYQTIGRAEATFNVYCDDGSFAPVIGQTVIITEGGLKLFAGCLNRVTKIRAESTDKKIVFTCDALDKGSILDHRFVKAKSYPITDVNGNPLVILYRDVVLDIVRTYLNGEGITTLNVPDMGQLDADLDFSFVTVTQAFDQISTLTGLVWWIDVNGDLHFSALDDLEAAPFNLTETSRNYRNLQVLDDLTNFRNTQYVTTNANVLPGAGAGGSGGGSGAGSNSLTETFDWHDGNQGILHQDGLGAVGIQVTLPIATIVSITVNGHAQTVVAFQDNTGQTSTGPNDFLWFYTKNTGSETAQPVFGPLPDHATVVVQYIPQSEQAGGIIGEAFGATPVVTPAVGESFGTCGSGIYEAVEQVPDITSIDDLNQLAVDILAVKGGLPTTITFETEVPGVFPGMSMNVNIPNVYVVNEDFLVTDVQMTEKGSDLGHGSSFTWTITLSSIRDFGNSVKWFERLIKRTQYPKPIPQYDNYKFVLAPGANLASGVNITNPEIITRTGKLVEFIVAWSQAPTDEDLILTIKANNVVVFTVRIASTLLANTQQTFAFPLSQPQFLFGKDVVNMDASYSVTGPNPAPAKSISAILRLTM